MASVRQEIVERCKAKLNTNTPSGVPAARLRRPLPIGENNAPLVPELNIYFFREDMRPATNKHSPLTKKEVMIIVETRFPINDPEKIETILEPTHTWVEKVLAGENLDNYVHCITPQSLHWVPFFQDKVYAISLFRFLIEYQTARDDPEAVQ